MSNDNLGTLTLRRFNGYEVFAVDEAQIYILDFEQEQYLNLTIESNHRIETTTHDTVEEPGYPNAEVMIFRKSFDPSALIGQRFQVDAGYDDKRETWVGRFYYFEHEDLNNNDIEFFEFADGRYHVKWTGVTQDVNYYDGSKSATTIEIDAKFLLCESKQD